jgi:hypothetical protein
MVSNDSQHPNALSNSAPIDHTGTFSSSGVATWPPENSEFDDMVFETLSNLECSFLSFQVEIRDVLK